MFIESMKIKIIGSGCWEGIPAPFCSCRVCRLAKEKPDSKDNRTRPEILVQTETGEFLIEISPDIRLQSVGFNLPDIRDYLISHWHFDHLYGLLELSAWIKGSLKGRIRLYCSEKTKEWLDRNFAHIHKEVMVLKPFEQFELIGVKITPIPVYHMKSMGDDDVKEDELNNTLGFVLEKDGKRVVYLSDYYRLPERSLEMVKNSDLVIADGTFLFEELFPDKRGQNRLKSDADHLHGKQILDFVKALDAKRVVFHSISHLTEKPHEELQELLPENMLISYDGIEFGF